MPAAVSIEDAKELERMEQKLLLSLPTLLNGGGALIRTGSGG